MIKVIFYYYSAAPTFSLEWNKELEQTQENVVINKTKNRETIARKRIKIKLFDVSSLKE